MSPRLLFLEVGRGRHEPQQLGRHPAIVEIADDMDFQTGFQDYEEDADSSGGEYGPLDPGRTYYLRMRAVGPPDDVTRIHSGWSEVKTIVTFGTPAPSVLDK